MTEKQKAKQIRDERILLEFRMMLQQGSTPVAAYSSIALMFGMSVSMVGIICRDEIKKWAKKHRVKFDRLTWKKWKEAV